MSRSKPEESWSVERLGKYCLATQKKLAVEAWRFGHALNLAKEKLKHGEWRKWKKQYVPYLPSSSEHRYRSLAERLTEASLEGVGLTEAYRLLDLTYTDRDKGAKNAEAPLIVGYVADDQDDTGPDGSDDLAGLSPPEVCSEWAPVLGVMEVEAKPETAHMATGPQEATIGVMEVEADTERYRRAMGLMEPNPNATLGYAHLPTELMEAEPDPAPAPTPQEKRTPAERYRLCLIEAQEGMQSLQSMTGWLKKRKEVFRKTMWQKHCVEGFLEQLGHTIEDLRWLEANLAA